MSVNFNEVKINDILYQKHPVCDMEAWWEITHWDNDLNGWQCKVVRQNRSAGETNLFVDFILCNDVDEDVTLCGNKNNLPEYFL